jgi:alpha-N-arabinofuranosidase
MLKHPGLTVFKAAVLFLAAIAPVAAQSPARNLLRNAGLEEVGADGLPAGFTKAIYGAQPVIAYDAGVKKEGRQSMRVSADQPSDTAVAQDVEVKPGAAYCFSGWIRTRDLTAEPRSSTYGTYQIQDCQGRTIARLTNHRGTTEWTQEKVYFLAPADGKVHVVCFFVGFGKGTGAVWFDDLRLEEAAGADQIVVAANRLQSEPISPLVYGNFMELLSDLVPSMWAEKLDAASFEYLRTPAERELRRSRFVFDLKADPHDRLWQPLGAPPHADLFLDPDRPFNGQVSQRIRLAPGGSEAGIAQEGIFVEKGEAYYFAGHFRQEGLAGPVHVELRQKGQVIAGGAISGVTADWSERRVALTPSATAADATFVLRISSPGTLWVDRVSLMPAKTVSGWRPDAVAAIRAMKPGIIRWGGSIIEGYEWQKGIGPWQKRGPFPNVYWGRIDPNFVGIEEFIAFCRATGAEPLVCVRWSGQKPADAAAMVEYCNGPADSRWGSLRARNGHAEPYWQIGNEVSGEAYDASVADFARAMRQADPTINVLSSYISEKMLRSAGDLIDFVCPHHYACADLPGTEASIHEFADLLRRFAPGRPIKLAVTEWNTTAGAWGQGRHTLWTLENGLACARYLNLCHRHADLVKIACRSNMSNSYCSGIIQTNNRALFCTPAYYVSKLYAEHGGTHPLELGSPLPLLDLDVSANLSADGKTFSLIAVNSQAKPVTKTIDLAALGRIEPTAQVWTIADADDARDREATNTFQRPDRIAARGKTWDSAGQKPSYAFPAYSVTLIEWRLATPAVLNRLLRPAINRGLSVRGRQSVP